MFTGSRKFNFTRCYSDKTALARFVSALLNDTTSLPVLTITIRLEKSEEYCVDIAIGGSSDDTLTRMFYADALNILAKEQHG